MVHAPVSKERIDVDQILRVDREHLIHPLSHPADHARPVVLVRGEGAELVDANGKRYFDALSGLWNVNVGHGRAELANVAAEQMGTLAFNNNYVGFVNVPAARLAEKLIELTYPNLNAVYFTTSGAESNESAFKTARFFWKLQEQPDKVKIISRRWARSCSRMTTSARTRLLNPRLTCRQRPRRRSRHLPRLPFRRLPRLRCRLPPRRSIQLPSRLLCSR